jgi:hypothetical protein
MKGHARNEIEKKHIQYSASDIRLLWTMTAKGLPSPVAGIFRITVVQKGTLWLSTGPNMILTTLACLSRKTVQLLIIPLQQRSVCQYFYRQRNLGAGLPSVCATENSTVSYQINKYFKPMNRYSPSNRRFIRNAGTYFLTITVHSENYFDAVIEEEVYTEYCKEVPVTPYIITADGKLPYVRRLRDM